MSTRYPVTEAAAPAGQRFPALALDRVVAALDAWADRDKPLYNFAPGQSSFNVWKALGHEPPPLPADKVLRYGDLRGSEQLRQLIARELSVRFSVQIDPGQICITNGGTEAIMLALQLLMQPGDELLTSQTCYPGYRYLHRFFGGVARHVPMRPDLGIDLKATCNAVAAGRRQVMIVNSPSNPFGTTMTEEELAAIAALPLPVVFDEVYQPLGLGHEAVPSAMRYTDRHFVVGSFAKSLAVPGLRLGYLVSPPRWAEEIVNIKALVSVCSSNAAQYVLQHLLLYWNLLESLHREYLRERHELFADVCDRLGLRLMAQPAAGLFATLQINTPPGTDTTEVALRLAEQYGVGVVPSTDFQNEGTPFLRLNFSLPRRCIEPGLVRLRDALKDMACL